MYLKIENLLDIPAIYLSEYIIQHKSEYYTRLRQVTENEDWESWILYILDMVEWTSRKGIQRLENILSSMKTTAEAIKRELPKAYSKDLMDILYKLPYTKRQHLIDAGLGTAKTVGNYLIELEEKGFLKSVKLGKEKLYLNHLLMKILENE